MAKAVAEVVGAMAGAEAVPVAAETRAICAALGVDPLWLISNGALLIACPDGPAMVGHLGARGIPAAVVGRVLRPEAGRWLVRGSSCQPLVAPDRDELWRVLEEL